MSDLIYRDALMDDLKKEGFHFPEYFEDIIKKHPAAYDLEAVLNELDNLRAKPTELVYDVPLIEHIIEIVRNGGKK